MELSEILSIVTNNGVAVAVVIYFLIRDYKFSSALERKLQELIDSVNQLTRQMKGGAADGIESRI